MLQNGVELIAAERERQIAKEGWTPEYDATHTEGQLAVRQMVEADAGRPCEATDQSRGFNRCGNRPYSEAKSQSGGLE